MSQTGVAERFAQAAGIKARYLEQGSGSPILLLHGGALGSSADVWERNLGPLASHGLRGIALDLPGHGGSEPPLEFTEGYRRRFVLELLDALGIERAGMVAHSSAGSLGVTLGFEHPDRITRLLILGTHSLLPPLPPGEASGSEAAPEEGPTDREPTIDDVRAVLESQLFDHTLITPAAIETRWQRRGHRATAAQREQTRLDRAAERGKGVPLWQRLDQLPIPMAMMYGLDDRPSTPRHLELLRERYPSLEVHVLERCRHIIQWDAAAEFEREAAAFFRD